ncbi:MAG: tRNA (adenosine(37)-N6)-threonylcarbamoyltransferase complex dimerization subunit type 1 TsaB [Alphaproteobacteria bacterium]|nr:MAG: tRNA (adenosine(37)-N6)-threonylcarbamoyltransferase complex dimerization subunit type 1 TsaB [Alphaproteobacteria bacterium]
MHTRLALDCSTTGLSLALQMDSGETFAFTTTEARSSDLLPTALQSLFTQSATAAANLTHIYVTTGPGSFTGIRLGLAVAEALKMVNPALAIIGLPTLHALAAQLIATTPPQGAFTLVTDAAGGQLYAQTFTAEGDAHTAAACVPATTSFTIPVYASPLLMRAGALPMPPLSAHTLFTLAHQTSVHLPPQPVYLKPLTYKLAP